MNKSEFKGLWIPQEICFMESLNWTEKLILAQIQNLSSNAECYRANEHFANLLQITKESASRAINKLVKRGYIISKIEYKEKTKQIIKRILKINWNLVLTSSEKISKTNQNDEKNVLNDDTPCKHIATTPLNKTDIPLPTPELKKKYIYKIKLKNNICAQNGSNENLKKFNNEKSTIELFERFYKSYPKKKGKHKALKWFKSHKPSIELVETMIKSIDTQKQTFDWQKENGKYIPYPTSWLNSGGWENEVNSEEIADISEKSLSKFLATELYKKLKFKPPQKTKEIDKLINSWSLEIEKHLSLGRCKEREDRLFYAISSLDRIPKLLGKIYDAKSFIKNIDNVYWYEKNA